MALRNYYWAAELSKMGHDVTIVASSYSHTRHTQPHHEKANTETNIDGIRYIFLKGVRYSQASAIGRARSMLRYEWFLRRFPWSDEEPYELIIASSPPPFVFFFAYQLARRWHSRLICDIRDLWPLTLLELGGMPKFHPVAALMSAAQSFACRKADLVTAVPTNAAAYLENFGLPTHRFMPLPNGIYDPDAPPEPLSATHINRISALKEKVDLIIGYAGAMGVANSLHTLIEALSIAKVSVGAVLVGHGSLRNDLISLSNELGVAEQVEFLDPIPKSMIRDFLAKMDANFVAAKVSKIYQYGASLTKVNDYLLAAKPIIYCVGDPNNAVQQSGGGIICKPENPTSIAAAMGHLASMSSKDRKIMGHKGLEWGLQHQLISLQMKELLQKIEDLPIR
ncbi:MAG: glycosyltransferase family 4 protein [Pseudomonadota bacterium]